MKNKKAFYFIFLICVLAGLLVSCKEETKPAGLANPAAVYCAKLGYALEGESCVFPDGTKANAWDFYGGKVGQKWSYGNQHGGKVESRAEDMGGWTAEYAVCVFPDGSECLEEDFFTGKCGSGECKEYKMSKGGCVKTK